MDNTQAMLDARTDAPADTPAPANEKTEVRNRKRVTMFIERKLAGKLEASWHKLRQRNPTDRQAPIADSAYCKVSLNANLKIPSQVSAILTGVLQHPIADCVVQELKVSN